MGAIIGRVDQLFCQYIYPVAFCPYTKCLLTLVQTHNGSQLFAWDTQTHAYNQLLWSEYTPVSISLIPGGIGFSFIDNGLIKVKQYLKKSAKTVLLELPIEHITQIHWLDNQTFYAHGYYHNRYCIVRITTDGNVTFLKKDTHVDYTYPQKVGDLLFYIQHAHASNTYEVCYTGYKNPSYQENIFSLSDVQPLFLHMQSETEGFFVSKDEMQVGKCQNERFRCFRFWKNETSWTYNWLFDFELPRELLVGEYRLYESLLPLLPYYNGDHIFFLSLVNHTFLSLYKYTISTQKTDWCFSYENQHVIGMVMDEIDGIPILYCGKGEIIKI